MDHLLYNIDKLTQEAIQWTDRQSRWSLYW
jgi:hypothetical protein